MRDADSEEIEEWRWSETRGVEIVVSAQTDNNSPSIKAHDHINSNATSTAVLLTALTTTSASTQTHLQGTAHNHATPKQPPLMDVEGKKDGASEAEKPASPPPVGLRELFRFADGLDYVLMGIGTVGAIVHGTSLPLFLRFFADLVNSFGSNANNVDKMTQEVLKVQIKLMQDLCFICLNRESGGYIC